MSVLLKQVGKFLPSRIGPKGRTRRQVRSRTSNRRRKGLHAVGEPEKRGLFRCSGQSNNEAQQNLQQSYSIDMIISTTPAGGIKYPEEGRSHVFGGEPPSSFAMLEAFKTWQASRCQI